MVMRDMYVSHKKKKKKRERNPKEIQIIKQYPVIAESSSTPIGSSDMFHITINTYLPK